MRAIFKSILLAALIVAAGNVTAQIINPGKALERKIINRTNREINKKADTAVDSLFNDKNKEQPAKKENKPAVAAKKDTAAPPAPTQPALQVYSKFDFVPGEKVIFFDDFSADKVGDFPALWNTNGSGEVVTNSLFPGKWFKITNSRSITTLAEPLELPENYTIEYEVIPQKDAANNGSPAFLFYLMSTSRPKDLLYGLARPGDAGIKFEFAYNNYYSSYYRDGTPDLKGSVPQPRLAADVKYKISVWVQKERIRLYINETKVFDLAKAMSKNYKYNMLRFQGGVEMIGNVRIATGLPDLRSKLVTEGKLVSYGIYFEVNSDRINPESYATLKGIAEVLQENPDLRVRIVGHTDADGPDAANLDLSKRRAASVKAELVRQFSIDGARLQTDGMGESQPVAPNDTGTNKALNRRVEFIRL